MVAQDWWKSSILYHIYVRSFRDSNGDGVGDFQGIIEKLPYLASLGVGAIWLSPIHPSPNGDWGYDVSDFTGILSDYGTDEDFDELITTARDLGIRVMMDEVFSHTSSQHAWFQQSLWGGETKDWYVWAAPRPDGTAPNNWLSVFGGPAWTYNPLRREYYFHKFYDDQPKLNWFHEDVRHEILSVIDFWMAKGVSGFRLDVANTYAHDPQLADNSSRPEEERTDWHWMFPPRLQCNDHDANRPENAAFIKQVRKVIDKYEGGFAFGEYSEHPELIAEYGGGAEGLHSFYTFELLNLENPSAQELARAVEALYTRDTWPMISFSNHDIPRAVTRLFKGTDPVHRQAQAKLVLFLLMTLRGTPILYHGDELGMEETEIPSKDLIKDRVGLPNFPLYKGRDGARTPIPWRVEALHCGFSTGEPWTYMPDYPKEATVAYQEDHSSSPLNFLRELSTIRNAEELVMAPFESLAVHDAVWLYQRGDLTALVNMSGDPQAHDALTEKEVLLTSGIHKGYLNAYGVALLK